MLFEAAELAGVQTPQYRNGKTAKGGNLCRGRQVCKNTKRGGLMEVVY